MSELDYLKEAEGNLNGFEAIDTSTMAIPFIRLAQDLTPQTKKQKDEYIEGLEPGKWFNTASKEILESFEFIVLKFERMYIEWKAKRGGMVGYHTPENAENLAVDKTFGKWKTADDNDLVEYYVYYGLIAGREAEGVVVLSFASTAIKIAKEWNRLMTTYMMDDGQGGKRRAMPYYLVFKIESQHKTKGDNDWFVPKVSYSRAIDGKVKMISKDQFEIITTERKHLPNKQADYAAIEDRSNSTSGVIDSEDDDL